MQEPSFAYSHLSPVPVLHYRAVWPRPTFAGMPLPTVSYLFFGISSRLLQTFHVLRSKDMAVNQALVGDDRLVNEYTQTAAVSLGVRPGEGDWTLPNNQRASETEQVCCGKENFSRKEQGWM